MNRFRHQLFPGAGFAAYQHVQVRGSNNLNLLFKLHHARRQANHLRLFYLLKVGRRARQHILAFKLLNQQRVAERPRRQRGNQPQLFIAEHVELVRRHAIEG